MTLNTPKIDSLRLLIPFSNVDVNPYHKEFLRNITSVNSDGFIISEKITQSYRLNSNPCSSHYQRATMIDKGIATDVIKLGFSSKIIQEDYLKGIDSSDVDRLVDFINNEGVIKINKRDLLNAKLVDTDICIDKTIDSSTTEDFLKSAYSLSELRKNTSPNLFNKPDNKGIEWSNRNSVGKAYKTKQYLKMYDKNLELMNKSKVFYDAYLKDNPFVDIRSKNIVRIETTIKNSAHWQSYELNIKTFKDLLGLDLTKCLDIFKRPLNHYLNGDKTIQHRIKLSPFDVTSLISIDAIARLNKTTEINAIEIICERIYPSYDSKNRKPRSRHRIKLNRLLIESKKQDTESTDKNQLNIISELAKLELM